MEEYNTNSSNPNPRQGEWLQAGQAQDQGRTEGCGYCAPNRGPGGSYVPGGGYGRREEGREAERKGRAGGYVLTGALCLLLGFAIGGCSAAVLLSGIDGDMTYGYGGGGGLGERIEDFIEEEWPGDRPGYSYDGPSWEDEEYVEPERQEYVPRELPDFDGEAPAISDPASPVPDIVEQVSGGVVGVNVYYEEDGELVLGGYGSGFVVSSEGYIITNDHVIRGGDSFSVTFPDGEEVEAEVIGGDVRVDTAVLKIEKGGLTPLALGDSNETRVGEFSLAIGNPSGSELAGSATFGIISATSRSINVDGRVLEVIQTDAAINMGSSGGPLLNMEGKVIGITTAKNVYAGYDEYGYAVNAEGLSFAIPINSAMEVVEQLITQGYVARPGMGINVIEITAEDAEYYEVAQGILIYSVTKNGPAHKAGIRVDDIVLEYDGIPAGYQDDFVAYVQELDVGDEVRLRLWRDGGELEVTVQIGDMNEMGSELVGDRVSALFE